MQITPDKTIVCTFDDTTRMIDFCKHDGVVSKEFYDWYLIDPVYFTTKGLLIIDMQREGREHKIPVSFDFSNPDEVAFIWYSYKYQLPICKFYFPRQDNLTMDDVCYDVEYESVAMFRKEGNIYFNREKGDIINSTTKDVKDVVKRANKLGKGMALTRAKLLEISMQKLLPESMMLLCRMFIYSTYAMMYYVSKQEPEEITTAFNTETNTGEKIKGIYKYTGYVDLRKNKIYRPLIKKDPNEPTREYERHIQKWIVRGHYRNTKNGKIWIAEHTKGQGELEKRIYSTEDEKDLNLIPKIFEVERNVKANELPKPVIKKAAIDVHLPITLKKISRFKKIRIFIGELFGKWFK